MYLTCVPIDRANPGSRQALSDCCDMHRNVMRLFSTDGQLPADAHVLYRVLEEERQLRLYLLSAARPVFSSAAWLGYGRDMRQLELDPLIESFRANSEFIFDLLAHPSRKIDTGRKNSARVFLRTPEERMAWLTRQGEKYGFEVCACREDAPYDIRGRRGTGLMIMRVIRFTGALCITDASAFRLAYTNGIGPEKAYGLGMLLLRRG